MAMTLSSTGGIPASIPDVWFKKELLKFGDYNLLYRRFAQKEKLPPGSGKVWKASRMKRLELPLDALSEGVTPAEYTLDMEHVSATASQFGIVVTLTDAAELTIATPLLQQAVMLVRDSMERFDNEFICEALLAGANVKFGGAATTRAGLAETDVLATAELKETLSFLEFPDDTWGAAPKYENGKYVCLLHRKHELDLLNDTLWKDMAIRQGRDALEKGSVASWMGIDFYVTNHGPKLQNLGNPTIVEDTTVVVADAFGLAGAKWTRRNGQGTLANSVDVDYTITRRHKHRRFEEGISDILDHAAGNDGANTNAVDVKMPSATAYVYSLYAGANNGTMFRVASNLAAGEVFQVDSIPSSGVASPARVGITGTVGGDRSVYVSFVMGRGAYAVVDLDRMEAGVSEDKRSDSDPLKQRRKVGAKWFGGALVLADNNLVRIEAASAF